MPSAARAASTLPEAETPLIEVNGLRKYFPVRSGLFGRSEGQVRAVEDVSFSINKGETLGLVGESGCGKTTVGRALLRLIEPTAGNVRFAGHDLQKLSSRELRRLRPRMQIIFQDPYSSLNPRRTVGDAIGEPMYVHGLARGPELDRRVTQLLERVGLPASYRSRYPHEFSGGQRQRVCIARALALNPEFIVCDEAVSALDISIQAQILNLLSDLQDELGLTYLFITHNLNVVRHLADRIAVMYLGKLVELGSADSVFSDAKHPYTQALVSANPLPDPDAPLAPIALSGESLRRFILPPGAAFTRVAHAPSSRAPASCPKLAWFTPSPHSAHAPSGATCTTMRRTLISALLVLLAALLVVGLTLSRSTRGKADFRFVNGVEPKTLNPTLMTGEPEGRIAEAIFEGLTRLEARSLEPVAGAAESWEVSPDGKTYTFHLRANARWSDGRPVTAHDFSYSWRRMQEAAVGSEYAYIMHVIRYAEAFNTHLGQAQALEGPVLKAWDELLAKHPQRVPQKQLLELAAQLNLHAVLKGTPNPKLRAFLLGPREDMNAASAADLRQELVREAARRRERYEEAARRFGTDGGMFAKDDRTFVVELVAPTPYFLELTAFHAFYPVPRWAVERSPRDWFLPGKVVGNGAFRLVSWQVGDRIRLERSPTYWGKEDVAFASIEALALENLTTALNLYLTGEVEWLPHQTWPQELGPDLRRRPDFHLGPALSIYYYRINTTRKPFDDVRVRKALNLAIDREQLTRDVLGMGQLPALHFVPPGIHGYEPPPSGIRYDVAQARKLLADAGFPGGKGFPKFGILFNTMETHKKIAEVLADQLRRNLNVEVAAYNQEWQSYMEAQRAMDYDLARAAWVGDYQDPNTFLDLWLTNGGNNRTGWGSVVYDQLLEAAGNIEFFLASPEFLLQHVKQRARLEQLLQRTRAQTETAPRLQAMTELRAALLAEAESILINDELPVIPLYVYVNGGMVKPAVKGFYNEVIGSDGRKRHNLKDQHPLRELGRDRSPPLIGSRSP